MLHLALKAFYPGQAAVPAAARRHDVEVPRDVSRSATGSPRELGLELLVHINQEGVAAAGSTRSTHGSPGPHRRDEDRGAQAGARRSTASTPRSAARAATRRRRARRSASSRSARRSTAGTRRTSARSCGTSTTRASSTGESIRVFPLSNWTELDVWHYIYREEIPIVPLYFAARAPGRRARRHADHGRRRPHAARAGRDSRELRKVRFRTLGCYPLTGAVESDADDARRRSSRRCCALADVRARRAA